LLSYSHPYGETLLEYFFSNSHRYREALQELFPLIHTPNLKQY